jgi:hypothetical protein
MLVVFGFLGWVGCTIGFIFGAFEKEGGFNNARALRWGLAVVACYALWVAGMAHA